MTTAVSVDKREQVAQVATAIAEILSTRSFIVDGDGAIYQLIKGGLPCGSSRTLFDSALSCLIRQRVVVRRRRGRVENISAEQPGIAVYLAPTDQK